MIERGKVAFFPFFARIEHRINILPQLPTHFYKRIGKSIKIFKLLHIFVYQEK